MKKLHTPNHKLYEQYYVNQAKQKGGSLPAFHGARFQWGYGLGSIFRGLFRWAMPHLQQGAKGIGKKALQTGVNVAQDVLEVHETSPRSIFPEFIAGTIRSWQNSYKKKSARNQNQFASAKTSPQQKKPKEKFSFWK